MRKDRSDVTDLQQIPNVGKAMAADFRLLGIRDPVGLKGRDPYALYDELCRITKVRHDPCVIDCFIAAIRYMEGGPAAPWWHFTSERKKTLRKNSEA